MASVSWISPPLPGGVCSSASKIAGLKTYRAATARSLGASSMARFLHDVLQFKHVGRSTPRLGDPVVHNLLAWHTFEGHHHIRIAAVKPLDHACHDIRLCVEPDNRIAQRNDEGLISHERSGAEDGVPEPQLPALSRVEVLHRVSFELQVLQLLLASRLAQVRGQLFVNVEVLFDRGLAARRDEQNPADPGQAQFFHHILDHRFSADGQHLLGLALRGRQQAGSVASDRNNGDINRHGQIYPSIGKYPEEHRFIGESGAACSFWFQFVSQPQVVGVMRGQFQ